jgi:HD-GYP domain-containing protein (c-di-GMP phosphodiesterase class II)
MVKRIAVVEESSSLLREAEKALGGKKKTLIAVEPGGSIPPTVQAALGTAKGADHLLDVAAVLGGRSERLLMLLTQAIDAREGIPMGNAPRLLDVAVRFGQALKLDEEAIERIGRGALLHDLGKIRVPNDALLTNAVLTHDEWELVRAHTVFGAEMALADEALADLAPIIRSHHECYDGTGYPDELEGDEIPFEGRVMKIIDVFCAMTGDRHYRKGHSSLSEAVAHLDEEAGKHFDPNLVAVFVKEVAPHIAPPDGESA